MKQVFLSTTTEFKEIDSLESGTWINLVNPSQSESIEIANAFGIDIADLRAPLDAEEMSRLTIEDEYTLIIVDVPITEERNNQTYYVTIPLGIIITEEAIITSAGHLHSQAPAQLLYFYEVTFHLSDSLPQCRAVSDSPALH